MFAGLPLLRDSFYLFSLMIGLTDGIVGNISGIFIILLDKHPMATGALCFVVATPNARNIEREECNHSEVKGVSIPNWFQKFNFISAYVISEAGFVIF